MTKTDPASNTALDRIDIEKRLLRNHPRAALALLTERIQSAPIAEQVDALNQAAFCHIQLSDFDAAESLLNQAIEISRSQGDVIRETDARVLKSSIDYMKNRYADALRVLQAALETYQNYQHLEGEANALQSIGRVYRLIGDFPVALAAHQQSLSIRERLGNPYELADTYIGIGLVYQSMDNHQEAVPAFLKALTEFEQLDDPKGKAMALGNLGGSYQALKDYSSALKNFERILPIFEESDDQRQFATTLCNIGLIYSATGRFQEAIHSIRQSLDIRRKIGNQFGVIMSILALHEAYKENGSPSGCEVLKELLDALSIAESIQAKKQIYRLHERIAECYEGLNDVPNAYKHFKAFHALKSEVFSEESDARLKNLEIVFKVEEAKKQAEIERLKNIELANALAEAEKQRQIAEEASRVKSEVLNVVAHNLQTPISSIINFTYLLKQTSDLSNKQSEMLTRIEGVSQAILRQTINLLNAASEQVRFELRREFVQLPELLQSVIERSGAVRKQQEIQLRVAPDAVVVGDLEKLHELFENLVDNAVKYSPRGATICVSGCRCNGGIQIAVKDAGQGLTDSDKQKLFGKFQRLSAKPTAGESSTGLGLYIAKQIVERHNGKIWAESEGFGKGSTFFVELPIGE